MTPLLQHILIALAVLTAAVWLARRALKLVRGEPPCAGGCPAGCGLKARCGQEGETKQRGR